MNLIEEIQLDNGLILKIFDLSRQIAADTVKVEVFFQTKIFLKESYFANVQDYNQVKNIMGDELAYEHTMEKSFVHGKDEHSVRIELIDTFKNSSLNYLSSANFSKKMALSTLRDIKNNPYKYRRRAGSEPEE